MEEPTGFW